MTTTKLVKVADSLLRIAEAQEPVRRFKHTAAVVYKGKIIGIGFNSLKSHPLQMKYGRNKDSIYLHAEVAAIKNALRRVSVEFLKHTTLISVRKRPDGSVGIAKPCCGCERCIAEFGIKKVYWTDETGRLISS
jgi:tRNA(Arg) A34 adenosine deaminase TadA